jgi:hypothetical protein
MTYSTIYTENKGTGNDGSELQSEILDSEYKEVIFYKFIILFILNRTHKHAKFTCVCVCVCVCVCIIHKKKEDFLKYMC